jgi:enoyl-CoA hydratase/carnithine racemase
LLALAEDMGMDKVRDVCRRYAGQHAGFQVPESIKQAKAVPFYRTIKVEGPGADGIAVVRVFRPEVKNALDRRTLSEIRSAMKDLGARDEVRGVVLTSFDGALAGADLGELSRIDKPEDAVTICELGHDVCATIERMDKPVVAAVNGPVMGGGAELSMACHGRVVGQNLALAQPEVNLGIIPGYGGTQRLPRLIGLERALDLLRTGRAIGAKDACDLGWAQSLALGGDGDGDVVATAKALIRQHLDGQVLLGPVATAPIDVPAILPAVDIGHRSRVIDAILIDVVRSGLGKPLAEGLAIEAQGFARCTQTIDMDIGMKNFVQNGPRVPAVFLHE